MMDTLTPWGRDPEDREKGAMRFCGNEWWIVRFSRPFRALCEKVAGGVGCPVVAPPANIFRAFGSGAMTRYRVSSESSAISEC